MKFVEFEILSYSFVYFVFLSIAKMNILVIYLCEYLLSLLYIPDKKKISYTTRVNVDCSSKIVYKFLLYGKSVSSYFKIAKVRKTLKKRQHEKKMKRHFWVIRQKIDGL